MICNAFRKSGQLEKTAAGFVFINLLIPKGITMKKLTMLLALAALLAATQLLAQQSGQTADNQPVNSATNSQPKDEVSTDNPPVIGLPSATSQQGSNNAPSASN